MVTIKEEKEEKKGDCNISNSSTILAVGLYTVEMIK